MNQKERKREKESQQGEVRFGFWSASAVAETRHALRSNTIDRRQQRGQEQIRVEQRVLWRADDPRTD